MLPSDFLLILGVVSGVPAAIGPAGPPPTIRVAVLPIDLNNLHKTEPDTSLAGRIRQLDLALRDRLFTVCGYQVVAVDSAAEQAAHDTQGYLYQHPDVAADLARLAGAQWVIVPRLNRATAWVADLQADVVRVRDSLVVSNRVIEIKGLELGPDLARHLVLRGAAWMADQISQAIEYSIHQGAAPRRCSPNAT
jgi:Protein of unknown function (DUF2380)